MTNTAPTEGLDPSEVDPTVKIKADGTGTSNLGSIVTNTIARRVLYGAYTVAAIAVGGISAYFLGIGHTIPEGVTGAQAVIAYLAIPFGGLALANTSKK